MVTSVTTGAGYDALAYLNKITGVKPVAGTTTSPVTTPTTPTTDTDTAKTPTAGKPTVNNLLGLSSDVLSLLQGTDPSSKNSSLLSDLYGSSSSTSTSSILSGLFDAALQAKASTLPVQIAVQTTQAQQTQNAANSNPLDKILSSYNSASNAYNKTLIQNAQATLKANSAPLVG